MAQEFLAGEKIGIECVVDARQRRFAPKEAIALCRSVRQIIVAGRAGAGPTEINLDASPRPTDQAILKCVIGPTGFLRAPAVRFGDVLLVGFSKSAYDDVLRRQSKEYHRGGNADHVQEQQLVTNRGIVRPKGRERKCL